MTNFPIETNQHIVKNKIDQNQKLDNWIELFLKNLSISKKIGYGYTIAIGISIIGTIIGLLIGDFYQKKAQLKLNLAENQYSLLQTLDYEVEQLRSHPQQLVAVMGNSIWFSYEKNAFRNHSYNIEDSLINLDKFIKNNFDNTVVDLDKFQNLSKSYSQAIETYINIINSLWNDLDPANIANKDIKKAQEEILTTITGKKYLKLWVEFQQLSEKLQDFKEIAKEEEYLANQELLAADFLRLKIIIGTMISSIIIAIFLAIRTSKAIAKPIIKVTNIAQNVTEKQNFKIQIPVNTKDEIGKLTLSLNLLIKWVAEYTEELELSRHNLEEKVEERTQKLSQTLLDLKQTQSKLIQSEKMSSLGKMVAGVAHEVNNPINFIYGNLRYLDEYFKNLKDLINLYQQESNNNDYIEKTIDDIELDFILDDIPKIITSMEKGSQRIRKIVESLRNFARHDESKLKEVDIREGLDNSIIMLNHKLNNSIKIIKNYEKVPLITCYPAQINQVFFHIINNAIDALNISNKETKEITIKTQFSKSEEIIISIKDNGIGIPIEIQDKLFDPFFTTKPIGEGQGLGLAICYSIIHQHRGDIKFISTYNEFTEFLITLPIKLYC